jgi:hypothetical protein
MFIVSGPVTEFTKDGDSFWSDLCGQCKVYVITTVQHDDMYRVSGWKVSKIKKNYISESNCHTRIRFMSSKRKTLKVSFSCMAYAHAPPHLCHHVRNHLNRQMAGRWIGKSGPNAWPPRSPDLTPLDFFLWYYMKNIVVTVTPNILQATWNEVEYRLDICRATEGAHIGIYWESYVLRKNFDNFPLL